MKRLCPTQEQVLLQFARKKGVLHRRELFALGVATIALTRLVRAGQLELVARGVYSPARRLGGPFRSMAEVALRAPRGLLGRDPRRSDFFWRLGPPATVRRESDDPTTARLDGENAGLIFWGALLCGPSEAPWGV
jgi:hypothetical protein